MKKYNLSNLLKHHYCCKRLTQYKLLKPKVTIKKITWDFRQTDSDFWPSVPHGHSQDGKFKIELWTGDVYDIKTKQRCGVAKRKEIEKLYYYDGFLDYVVKCRQWYRQQYPSVHLKELQYPDNWRIAVMNRSNKYIDESESINTVFALSCVFTDKNQRDIIK